MDNDGALLAAKKNTTRAERTLASLAAHGISDAALSEDDRIKVDDYRERWEDEYYRNGEGAVSHMIGRLARNQGTFEVLYAIREVLKGSCGMDNSDISAAVSEYRNR